MRVTSKGQVTIPKHIRRRAGIRAGAEVDFSEQDGAIVVRKTARSHRAGSADDGFADYLDSVTGVVDLGMTTDQFMQLLRGE